MQPFIGFAPDLEATTPGVITDCTNLIPTTKGYKGAPSSVDAGYSVLPYDCTGAKIVTKLDGTTRRLIAGSVVGLYEAASGGWTDVTRASIYSTSSNWVIDQFGDVTLAAAGGEPLQASTTGDFADVAGSPEAQLIAVSDGFVMAANIGTETDRWKCCAYNDYTDWTLSAATQCVTGRIVDVPGPIYGLKAFGSGYVVYKETGVFIGEYVGTPEVWRWTQIPGTMGTTANGSIVDVGYAHMFMGMDDFYIFDGARVTPLNAPIREWFYAQISSGNIYFTKSLYDPKTGNVYWWYMPTGETTLTKAVVYNVRTNKWGVLTKTIQQVFNGAFVFGSVDTYFKDYVSIVDSSKDLQTLTGASASSSLTTGNLGDDTQFSVVRRVTPRFIDAPTTATMQLYEDNTYGDSFTAVGSAVSLDSNGRFDVLNSARWHKCKFDFTGDVEIVGARYDLVPDGAE